MVDESKLALLGGNPVINFNFKKFSTIDESDELAVNRVMRSKKLSEFIGNDGDYFLGGKEVRDFEDKFKKKFGVDYAISINSWTSGLWVAIGALGLEPGSEVITSSWTMVATATTILHWNLVPVFADIDSRTFNLDLISVEARITEYTRAIVSPDIFGQSSDVEGLLEICKRHNLILISDSAQSPMATRNGYFAGTVAHIGGFSFNHHKHIQTGEGGMLVTNDSNFADRMQLLRNHGEMVIAKRSLKNIEFGILGMNMRLGEIEAAIGSNQLNKLETSVKSRRLAAERLTTGIRNLEGIKVPFTAEGNNHVYYIYGLCIDQNLLGVTSKKIFDALIAEGVPALMFGYQNIHKIPLFKYQLTYKGNPLPYSLIGKKRAEQHRNLKLPVAEYLHNESFIGINWCTYQYSDSEVDGIIRSFEKIWLNLDQLRKL
jgi:dTDP-4-amino-4,6-dideoxygalactose transaminase